MNLQVDDDLLAYLNSSNAQISITSSIDVALKAEGEHIGEALRDIEPLDTLSPT